MCAKVEMEIAGSWLRFAQWVIRKA
jgi:hypothetical protein